MKRSATTTAPLPSDAGPQALSAYIQARFDEFSRSQKDVAQYIVDHLDEVAFQTAEELARRANTSSSTVVRFSQALGFEGYPELQASAREEYRRRHADGQRGARRCSRSTRARSRPRSPPTTRTWRRPRARPRARRSTPRSRRSRPPTACSSSAPTRWPSSPPTCATCSCCSTCAPRSPRRRRRRRSAACRRIDERTLVIGLSAGRPHPLVTRAMKLARHRKARDDRHHRRDAVRRRQARADPPVLLVQQPGLRALARRAAVASSRPWPTGSTRATRASTRSASRPSA